MSYGDRLDNIWPLKDVAEKLGVEEHQLRRWAEPDRNIGFPEAVTTFGRYKLYDVEEVQEWLTLWERVTKNFRNGDDNG